MCLIVEMSYFFWVAELQILLVGVLWHKYESNGDHQPAKMKKYTTKTQSGLEKTRITYLI